MPAKTAAATFSFVVPAEHDEDDARDEGDRRHAGVQPAAQLGLDVLQGRLDALLERLAAARLGAEVGSVWVIHRG